MILNPINIGHYLLQDALLTPSDLVDHPFTIHPISSRNSNYIINKNNPKPLFIKQIRIIDAEKIQTLRREATCYWLAKYQPKFEAWATMMPDYIIFDPYNHILITEYFNAVSLHDFLLNKTNKSHNLGLNIANVLIQCHNSELPKLLKKQYANYFPCELPFVFQLARDGFKSGWRVQENFQKELFDLITTDGNYIQQMKDVSKLWSIETVIHNDIKLQNFLIDQNQDVRLIDWEICDIGDFKWDLAAVFHMFFIAWINEELTDQDNKISSTILTLTLPEMQEYIHSFWRHYSTLSEWSDDQSHKYLRQTLKYCSLKLVHTSFEITNQHKKVDPYVTRILQLGLHILRDVEAIINELIELK